MSKQKHKHTGGNQHTHKSHSRQPHKDWRTWVVVGLMLAGIAVYILTFDESIVPGTATDQPEVPAAVP